MDPFKLLPILEAQIATQNARFDERFFITMG
jgi:hypothetical protein